MYIIILLAKQATTVLDITVHSIQNGSIAPNVKEIPSTIRDNDEW